MNKTFKDIRESIAPASLARLKKHYKPLKNIDWSKHKGQVEKTTLVLKRLKMGTLIDLYKENIPLISDIAKSLVLKDKRFAHHVESIEVEESRIMGLKKSSKEYKAGYAAAKKGKKYDDNPYTGKEPGFKRLNWSTGHNDFRADALRKAGKPNYGARGQFEEIEEGTWHISKDMSKLKKTMKRPMPKSSFYYNFVVKHIGDDELWDDLGDLKSGQDMVPAIKKAMKRLGIKEEVEIDEADLTKTQIKKVHDKADELPKHDFIKRYGKDGDAVRYATATNIVKKKLGIEEERSPEVAGVLKKYIIGHPLRWSSKEGKKNKKDFIKLQNLALTDMGKFRKKFADMEVDKGDDNYNQQAVRDVLAKAGLSKHLPK